MKLVEKQLFIAAPPARIYELLTDADELVRWMAPIARATASVGGEVTWTHPQGDQMIGEFVELVPDRRVVFTFGWHRPDIGIPAGSTTVEITLRPVSGGTQLHLIHRGLEEPLAGAHAGGWDNYLTRLAACAEGRDPGRDPLEGERVPTASELDRHAT
jgi:uncharacterized protein YndB with AHSA1/START domain